MVGPDGPDRTLDREEGTARRQLTGPWRALFAAGALGAAGFHLYTGAFGLIAAHVQITVHWAFMSFLILLLYHHRARAPRDFQPWLDLLIAAGSVAAGGETDDR